MNSGENQETDYNRSNRSQIGLFRVFNPQGQSQDNFIGKMRIFYKNWIFEYMHIPVHVHPSTCTSVYMYIYVHPFLNNLAISTI